METDILLSVVISPEVEDAIVDWLLQQEQISGFTSLQVSGHGASPHSMSVSEQVAGRRRQVMFQTHLSEVDAVAVIKGLEENFSGSGMHYWSTPVLTSGHLD
jgi:peptidase E